MSKKKNTDHVKTKDGGRLVTCDNCGGSYEMHLPAPFDVVIAIMKAFLNIHKDCKEKPVRV